ncbi:MAG: Mercuric transport protein MerT, partial [Deltaproteobacteria bacterium]|nr:Mercuric transport protein MerT [Deltaproteobacteria bacterium]
MSVDDTSPKRLTIATTAGSIAAAVLASACCVGPLILALLGIGGGALRVKLEPLRPLFRVVTVALLGTGFYVTYRKR